MRELINTLPPKIILYFLQIFEIFRVPFNYSIQRFRNIFSNLEGKKFCLLLEKAKLADLWMHSAALPCNFRHLACYYQKYKQKEECNVQYTSSSPMSVATQSRSSHPPQQILHVNRFLFFFFNQPSSSSYEHWRTTYIKAEVGPETKHSPLFSLNVQQTELSCGIPDLLLSNLSRAIWLSLLRIHRSITSFPLPPKSLQAAASENTPNALWVYPSQAGICVPVFQQLTWQKYQFVREHSIPTKT